MKAPLESPADEVVRLRGSLDDLAGLIALPAFRAGGEPSQIVGSLLDALSETLRLAFVFVRLSDPEGGSSAETMRVGAPLERIARARDLGAVLDDSLGIAELRWPPSARVSIGGVDLAVATARLGLHGEVGVLVAGSQRLGFPHQSERLFLDVGAGQAAIGLQHARLLGEHRRLATVLDERVGHRTRALVAANDALKAEIAERRRAEDALHESERESRLIVDNIPGLVALLSSTGYVEVVNRQLLEYFGQTLEELRQWGTNDTVHPEDLPHVIEVFGRSIASGSPYKILQRFRRSDGAYRWFENSGFPLRDAAGRVVRWCVLLTDIDERKRAEDALKRSERSLQLIIDAIPAQAWCLDPDGRVAYLNQRWHEYTGISQERAYRSGPGGEQGGGATATDMMQAIVHPEDVQRASAKWLHEILPEGKPGEFEVRLRRADGLYRWFIVRVEPMRDERGAIVRWYGTNTDIEDLKRAEAELRQAYGRLAEAQRLSKTGSFITDLVADDHKWSEEACRIFEFDPATKVTVGMILDVIHPEDLPVFDAAYRRALEGLDLDLAYRIVTAAGNVKHIRAVAHVLEQVAGRPVFIGAIQDVTASKAAEEALDRARSELAHVARATTLSTLTASIAHEVNQPLSGIITNASTCLRMLAADPPDIEGARETARRTIRDGNRASDVIARLRALFAKKEFSLEPLDLNDATREVVALSLSDLQRSRVIVQSELADDLPAITGDRVQLQQVILNLLRNAADAMAGVDGRPRQLLIKTEREAGDRVRVTVRDAGVGVDRQSMDKLFDPFYTTKSGGMGIGLSVSRSIVERHHGRLWAEPNDGPGATFAFSIPCRPARAEDSAPAARTS